MEGPSVCPHPTDEISWVVNEIWWVEALLDLQVRPQGPQRSPCGHQGIHRRLKGRPWATPKGNQGILRTLKGLLVTPLRIIWDFPEAQFFCGWVLAAGL